jgi:hypothetical protein
MFRRETCLCDQELQDVIANTRSSIPDLTASQSASVSEVDDYVFRWQIDDR